MIGNLYELVKKAPPKKDTKIEKMYKIHSMLLINREAHNLDPEYVKAWKFSGSLRK
jgi:hypothetical protein